MALPVLSRDREMATWDPFRELADPAERVHSPCRSRTGGRSGCGVLAADVREHEDASTVAFDLPGVRPEDVDVEVRDRTVTVSGEIGRKERRGFFHRRTRRVSRFRYAVTLPGEVDPDGVGPSLRGGVLTIRLPEPAATTRRRTAISR